MKESNTQKVVMISGANRGIGAAIATRLAAEGWQLSLGMRDPDKAAGRFSDDCLIQRFDALRAGDEVAWVEATRERFGRIDAVVNNAGVMIPKTVLEISDDEMDEMLTVNLKSPLRLVRAAYPDLARSGSGRVVTVVSLSGKRVKTAMSGSYSVSKFAALGLVHALRHAGWDDGVRSTALCPGFVATDMAFGLTDMDPAIMTQPKELARLVSVVLDMPNNASIAELPVNTGPEGNL